MRSLEYPAGSRQVKGLPDRPPELGFRQPPCLPHLAKDPLRQQWILGQMRQAGWLTETQFRRAIREPLHLAAARRVFEAPHFVDLLLCAARSQGLRENAVLSPEPAGNPQAKIK